MQEFVPAGFVLVIVLRHVVRQARHKRTSCRHPWPPRFGGRQPPWKENLYTEMGRFARAFMNVLGVMPLRAYCGGKLGSLFGKEENSVFSSARALEAINRGGLPWLLAW